MTRPAPTVSRWFTLAERIAPWFAGFLLAVPVVLVRYPPMGDLAMHEASVSIMRHLGDPSWAPPGLYYLVMPQANQLFLSLAWALSYVVPTDTACKLVVAATIAAVPPSGARLLASLGRSRWLSLLLGPVICGWVFKKGLVANMTGLLLLLLALPSVERLVRRPSISSALKCSALGLLTFFAHESSAFVFAALLGVFAVLRHTDVRRLAACLAPAATLALAAAAQLLLGQKLESVRMHAIGSYFGMPPGERLRFLPYAVFGGTPNIRIVVLGSVFTGALLVSALVERRRRIALPAPGPGEAPQHVRVLAWRQRYAVGAVLLFGLYLASPMALHGSTLIAYRFLCAACTCLVVACACRTPAVSVALLSAAAPFTTLIAEAREFARAEVLYDELDRIIPQVPKSVAVMQLDLTPRPATQVAAAPPAAARVLAERGGRMLFAWTDTPPNPVYMPRRMQWYEANARLGVAPYELLPAFDLRRFSYLIAYDQLGAMRPYLVHALAPEAELVAIEGDWLLFRSRLPTVALTAPDEAPPASRDTLGARLDRMLDEERSSGH